MRFVTAWACGMSTTWAIHAWLGGNTGWMYFALVLVFITSVQSLHWAALAQFNTPNENDCAEEVEKAVAEKLDAMEKQAPPAIRQIIQALRHS